MPSCANDLDSTIKHVRSFLDTGAQVPFFGAVPAALKILLGTIMEIAGAIMAILSCLPAICSSKARPVLELSFKYLGQGLWFTFCATFQAIPGVGYAVMQCGSCRTKLGSPFSPYEAPVKPDGGPALPSSPTAAGSILSPVNKSASPASSARGGMPQPEPISAPPKRGREMFSSDGNHTTPTPSARTLAPGEQTPMAGEPVDAPAAAGAPQKRAREVFSTDGNHSATPTPVGRTLAPGEHPLAAGEPAEPLPGANASPDLVDVNL